MPTLRSAPGSSIPSRQQSTRRGTVKVPCDECIQRASLGNNGSNIQLCEQCMSHLHRPRRRQQLQQQQQQQQQQQVNKPGKIRRHTNAIIDTALGLQTKPISLPWSDDSQVQHALQFFVEHSAPQLAGYFDSPFWQRMILQGGRLCPAIKHAIAAIGALHERLLIGGDKTDATHQQKTRFALEQCNESIKYITNPVDATQPPDLRMMLTTCVLFTCFEAMQGHCEQAIAHATQGYALLKQYATDPASSSCEAGAFAVELDQLCLIMQRLQTQSKGLMGKHYTCFGTDAKLPKIVQFDKLRDARMALEHVINRLSIFFLDLDLNDNFYDLVCSNADKFLTFQPWLKAWEEAFSQLLKRTQAEMTPTQLKGARTLKAHHLVCEILCDVDLSEGELGWDKFHKSFTAIVDLAEAVLEDDPQPDWRGASEAPKTQLCFSLGVVDPLYEVCARCRDPALRRRALDLLARYPRQECMWSSWSAWKVGKYLMNLEEERSNSPPLMADDIAAEDRVSEAWFDFSENPSRGNESIGRLMYKRTTSGRRPRMALNPGLFAENTDRQLNGQDIDFAPNTLRSNFLESRVTATNGLGPTWTIFDSESGTRSASMLPEDA